MISIQTLLSVVDNTGVKKVQCIKTLNGTPSKTGQIILVSLKKLKWNPKKKIKYKKGDILKALVIRTKYPIKNTVGNYIKFFENSVVLLNSKQSLLGNRIFGPVPRIFRKNKNLKVILIASYIL